MSEEQPQYSREDLEQMGLDEREINAYLNDADSDGESDGDEEGDEDGEAVAVGADGDAADDGSADDDAGPGEGSGESGAEEEAERQPGAQQPQSLSDDGDNPGAAPDVVADTGRYRPRYVQPLILEDGSPATAEWMATPPMMGPPMTTPAPAKAPANPAPKKRQSGSRARSSRKA